jgi:hypothetical protein
MKVLIFDFLIDYSLMFLFAYIMIHLTTHKLWIASKRSIFFCYPLWFVFLQWLNEYLFYPLLNLRLGKDHKHLFDCMLQVIQVLILDEYSKLSLIV